MVGIDRLTERQRSCLRLVAEGFSSKEIARQLDISALRADKDIAAAMKTLGVARRIEAARLLARHEDREVNVLPGGASTLPDRVDSPPFLGSSEGVGDANRLREDRATYQVAREPPDLGLPLRRRGGSRNDLGFWQRVIWIGLLTAAVLAALAGLANGIASLSNRIVLSNSAGR